MSTDNFVIRSLVIAFLVLALGLNAVWLVQTIHGGEFPVSLQNLVFGVDALILTGVGAVLGVSKFTDTK